MGCVSSGPPPAPLSALLRDNGSMNLMSQKKRGVARASVGLVWLIFGGATCTCIGETAMAKTIPQESSPAPQPPPGLGKLLEQMKAEADKVIRSFKTRLMLADRRHREAIFELFAVMRPRFGPANAQLFNEREKKLVELARALGAEDPMPPDVDGHRLDQYFDAVEHVTEALRARGLEVEVLPVLSGAIDWAPVVPGRMLRAIDPTRKLPEYIPYAELLPEPPKPKQVPPRVTLYLFPLARMSATQDMVRREQPGDLAGALEGAYVFTLQAPQSGDTDDGKTAATVVNALFPGAKAKADPKLAAAVGARSAEQLRGVLRISTDQPPQSLPSSVPLPTGAVALLWSVERGVEIEHILKPSR